MGSVASLGEHIHLQILLELPLIRYEVNCNSTVRFCHNNKKSFFYEMSVERTGHVTVPRTTEDSLLTQPDNGNRSASLRLYTRCIIFVY
jgi:hypothetical protein